MKNSFLAQFVMHRVVNFCHADYNLTVIGPSYMHNLPLVIEERLARLC